MDDEREAVHPPEAVRVDDPRLECQALDDLEVVVLEQVVAGLAGGGDDHRVEERRPQHVVEQRRRAVDHHGHTLGLERGDPAVVDRGRHDRLAGQLLGAEVVELVHGRDDHRRVAHRAAQHEVRPLLERRRGHQALRRPVEHVVGAARVQRQRVERRQQLGHAHLQQRVGEDEVRRVLRHRLRQLVVGAAREEQDDRVVEVVAEPVLDVAQRPLLQDVGQAPARRDRDARHDAGQPLAVAVDEALRADRVAVLDHADADGVGVALPVAEQLDRPRGAAVGADARDMELPPQEPRGELEVLVARAQADPDDSFHRVPPSKYDCTAHGAGRCGRGFDLGRQTCTRAWPRRALWCKLGVREAT